MRILAKYFLVLLILSSAYFFFFTPQSAEETHLSAVLEQPSFQHWMGCDALGRDLFIRTLLGAATSLGLSFVATLAGFALGAVYGAVSALSVPKVRDFLLRIAEVLMSLPSLIFIAILFLLSKSLFVALALSSWMLTARLTNNLLQKELGKDYVEAAKALGCSSYRVFWKHLLPNILPEISIFWILQIPYALQAESIMSFLGFGVQAPQTSWGLLLREGWSSLNVAPNLLLGPSLILFLTVLAMNVLWTDPQR